MNKRECCRLSTNKKVNVSPSVDEKWPLPLSESKFTRYQDYLDYRLIIRKLIVQAQTYINIVKYLK